MSEVKTASRFNDRVENYEKFRPRYAPQIVNFLESKIDFNENMTIADIGSGTGILAEMFLKHGNKVYGIEPNNEMRRVAERRLSTYEKFISIDGLSNDTKLEEKSVDLITAGQSFHWFERESTKEEFRKILAPGGTVLLFWNMRDYESEFMKSYQEIIMKYYEKLNIPQDDSYIDDFFAPHEVIHKIFENPLEYTFERLIGETASQSYLPNETHKDFEPMKSQLKDLFDVHQKNGLVTFEYKTHMYYSLME